MNIADMVQENSTTLTTATIALAGASSPDSRTFAAGFTIGTTDIPVRVKDSVGNFEIGMYTLTSAALLTRTSILRSSNGGAAVTFPAGTKTVANVLPADIIADLPRLSEGVAPDALPIATSIAGGDYLIGIFGGVEKRILASAVQTFMAGAVVAAPAAVTSLAAGTVTTTTIPLTWVNSSGATGWVVKQRLAGAGSYIDSTLSGAATSTGATPTGLTAGTAYDFQVFATNTGGTSPAATLLAISTAASAVAATGVTMTGPPGGTVSVQSTNFTVGVTPVGGTISGTVVVTPSDNAGGGTFAPTSVSLTSAAPTATFKYTPSATAGARTISITNNGSLTNPANITYTSTSASNTHTITPFTAGNTFQATLSRSLAANTYATQKQFASGIAMVTDATYWNIAPASAVGARCGWSLSNATPPADITAAQNTNSDASVNGMRAMGKPGAHVDECLFWAPASTDSGPWYFWIKPIDGNAQVMNPSGLLVVA